MKVLVIDDETGKREQIVQFLASIDKAIEVAEARSFQSAIDVLRNNVFDWIILDMRLTTYDVSAADDGGRPRNFGGDEVLRKMKRRGIHTNVLVLTQYSIFRVQSSMLTLEQLGRDLASRYPFFRGLVFFQHSNNAWQNRVRQLLYGAVE